MSIFEYIQNGEIKLIDELLSSRPELINYQEEGWTLLQEACLAPKSVNKYEIIRLLVNKYHVDIEDTGDANESPFRIALQQDPEDFHLIKLLKDLGAQINFRNTDGDGYLGRLLTNGWFSRVQFLLELGADCQYVDSRGTPLTIAVNKFLPRVMTAYTKVQSLESKERNNILESPVDVSATQKIIKELHEKTSEVSVVPDTAEEAKTKKLTPRQKLSARKTTLLTALNLLFAYGAGMDCDFDVFQHHSANDDDKKKIIKLIRKTTRNKVFIGATLNGKIITQMTPGFEKAITTIDQLEEAIRSGQRYNLDPLIATSLKIIKKYQNDANNTDSKQAVSLWTSYLKRLMDLREFVIEQFKSVTLRNLSKEAYSKDLIFKIAVAKQVKKDEKIVLPPEIAKVIPGDLHEEIIEAANALLGKAAQK